MKFLIICILSLATSIHSSPVKIRRNLEPLQTVSPNKKWEPQLNRRKDRNEALHTDKHNEQIKVSEEEAICEEIDTPVHQFDLEFPTRQSQLRPPESTRKEIIDVASTNIFAPVQQYQRKEAAEKARVMKDIESRKDRAIDAAKKSRFIIAEHYFATAQQLAIDCDLIPKGVQLKLTYLKRKLMRTIYSAAKTAFENKDWFCVNAYIKQADRLADELKVPRMDIQSEFDAAVEGIYEWRANRLNSVIGSDEV